MADATRKSLAGKMKCLQLIELYRRNPCLWYARHPDFRKKRIRNEIWQAIAAEMGEHPSSADRKMKSLLGTYRKERWRQKLESRKSDDGKGVPYVSKWFAYESFKFLAYKHFPEGEEIEKDEVTIESDYEEDNHVEITFEDMKIELPELSEEAEEPQPLPPKNTKPKTITKSNCEEITFEDIKIELPELTEEAEEPQPSPPKKAKLNKTKDDKKVKIEPPELPEEAKELQPPSKVKKIIEKSLVTDKSDNAISKGAKIMSQEIKDDICTSFGRYIASELRVYDDVTLMHVKKDIISVILAANSGTYRPNTVHFEKP